MQFFRKIFSILQKEEKKKIWRLIALDITTSLLDIFFLIALLFILNFYTQHDRATHLSSWFTGILNQQPLLLIGIFSLLFALKNLFTFTVLKRQYRFAYEVASRLSENKLSEYLEGSYHNYVQVDSSVHFRSILNNPLEFSHYVLRGFQQVIGQSVLILFALVPILIFKPVLFSLLILILAPPVLFLAFFLKRKQRVIRNSAKNIQSKLIQYLKEAIAGFVESKIYERELFFKNRFIRYQVRQSKSLAEEQILQTLPSRFIEVFVIFGLFFLIALNFFTKGRSVDLLTIGAFMAAAYKVIPGIVKILNSVGQMRAYDFTMQNLLQQQEKSSPEQLMESTAINSIHFSNISFAYKNKAVLKNFSFALKQGDLAGLSGASGTGKTTAMNLLLGFLETDSGSILINGIARHANERQGFRCTISYVQQQPLLINDTILRNITLQENNYDIDRLDEVSKLTGLCQITGGSMEGLNTNITEDGKNISGGQRQRIALARALYKNADLIILDEPFNELDRKSENCILAHLKELAHSGKIIILITHDKESLSYCSKIVSLDEH
ncbi:MAG TPA: ABC transporter ATP-binding protein [Chitinophagaceae bacterium]|jgi:ABC-type multidrug transport system fused ATPase/permease subunit|nr:ABC transporter ATP-binding protein [Chitinophagaceae bacterium]